LEIEVSFKFKALFMMCILSIKPATNLMKALVCFFFFFFFSFFYMNKASVCLTTDLVLIEFIISWGSEGVKRLR
jgi:hypothetical protein